MLESPILIKKYDPNWKTEFERLEKVLLQNISTEISRIEHVGSTSIENLYAKPIIDIDIVIEDNDLLLQKVISELATLEYSHLGNLGISGREAFKRLNSKTPNNKSKNIWHNHNLYLCKEGSIGLLNHLNFRNHLRNDSNAVIRYGNLKKELAQKFPYNIDAYIDGKTSFIIEILERCGMNKNSTKTINTENRIPK